MDGIPDPNCEPDRFAAAMAAWGFGRERIDDAMALRAEYFQSVDDGGAGVRRIIKRTRISSFFSNDACGTCWSALADRHQGFCIVFSEEILRTEVPEWFLCDIRYAEDRPTVDTFLFAVASDQREWHEMVAHEEGSRPGGEDPYWDAADAAEELRFTIWRDLFCVVPAETPLRGERRLMIEAEGKGDRIRLPYSAKAVEKIIIGGSMRPEFLGELVVAVAKWCERVRLEQASLAPGKSQVTLRPFGVLGGT